MKLRKSGRTEVRLVEKPRVSAQRMGSVQGEVRLSGMGQPDVEGEPTCEEVEGDLWEDLDGNVHAWTPKGSGVISIEIRNGNEETAEALYKKLKAQPGGKTVEEELAELKEAFAKVCRRLAELEQR